MEEQRREGIVLSTFDYKEAQRIIRFFTPNSGVISLIVRQISAKNPQRINLTTPLSRAEIIYRKGKSDLYRLIDGSILDMHLSLRSSYALLTFAGKMLQAILKSQMPGKSAPALYHLLQLYLKNLHKFPHPEIGWASFVLKLLKHEGLLSLSPSCSKCSKTASHLSEGESYCTSCASPGALPFSSDEWNTLITLCHSRDFDSLHTLSLEEPLLKTIEMVFNSRII